MQGGAAGGGKRRKRSDLSELSFIGNEDGRNATLVSYALFRGFMNSIDADSYHCKVKYICEGAEESLKYGHLAPKIINLTRYSCFESLLKPFFWWNISFDIHRHRMHKLENGQNPYISMALSSHGGGAASGTCSEKYPLCTAKPDSYRSVSLDNSVVEESGVKEALEAFDKMRSNLRSNSMLIHN